MQVSRGTKSLPGMVLLADTSVAEMNLDVVQQKTPTVPSLLRYLSECLFRSLLLLAINILSKHIFT